MAQISPSFHGVWTALVTPFAADGSLDLDAYRRIVRAQVAAKVAGVVPCGTTGESPTLSREERRALIQACVEETKGTATRVMAGTGSNDTEETIELTREAESLGASAALVVAPYYNKPSQDGLLAHFRAVADAVKIPIVLYNVPGRTGVAISAKTIAELAAHPRINAIKEATGDLTFQSEVMDQLALAGRKLDLLSGDDLTYLAFLAQGGHGVVSVASNLAPRALVDLQSAFDFGDWKRARGLHERLYPLFRDLFIESNPAPIKHAMARAGICPAAMRAPLAPMSAKNIQTLETTLERAGIAKGRTDA